MQEIKLPNTVLKYKGIFDINGLYKFMSGWLINEGFEFYERKYKHKPPEIELNWEAEKKITGYVKYVITVDFHFYGVKDVEVIKNGEKKKMQDARVIITFSGKVQTDYPDDYGGTNWDETSFLRKMQRFFNTYIIRQDIDFKHVDPLYYYILKFYDDVKAYLGMEGSGSIV